MKNEAEPPAQGTSGHGSEESFAAVKNTGDDPKQSLQMQNSSHDLPKRKSVTLSVHTSSSSDDRNDGSLPQPGYNIHPNFVKPEPQEMDTMGRTPSSSNEQPLVLRRSSEEVPSLRRTSARRVSVPSTKGKLMGCRQLVPEEASGRRSLGSYGWMLKKGRVFSRHKRLIAFCLCLVDFASFLSMSIIAPFFPREAAKKGMRQAVTGFVFSIYSIVTLLTSPIFGKLLPAVGAKFMFLTGVFCCGLCNILFGFLDKVDGQLEFAVLCFVLRILEALGASAYCTASCTILIVQFPDDISAVLSFTETCIGIGMSIGPAVGGALYSVGGFGLPFFTLGGFVLLIVPVCSYLMPVTNDFSTDSSSSASYRKMLTMPHIIALCVVIVTASQAQGFIDPTLEPHLRKYNLGTVIVGLMFLLVSAAYAIAAPIVGWICGKVPNHYPVMLVGLAFTTVSLLLLGPSDMLPLEGSMWLTIISLAILGASFAAAYVPTFECMFLVAIRGGMEDDLNTYALVSGLWNSMYSMGEAIGPSLGGVLSDLITFPVATTVMALFTGIAFFITIAAWLNRGPCFRDQG